MPTPSDSAALLAQADGLHRSGQLARAEAAYRQLLAAVPDHPAALYGLGMLYLQGGAPGPAAEALERLCQIAPGNAEAHRALALARKATGDPAGAEQAARNAVRAAPDDPNMLTALGDARLDRNDFAGALAAYGKAIKRDPDHLTAHHNSGLAHKGAGDLEAAVAAYRRTLAIKPGLTVALNNLGNALRGLGRLSEAEEAFRTALQGGPDNPDVLANLATVMQAMGRYGEALSLCQTALKQAGERPLPAARANQAAALLALNRPDEAEATLNALLNTDPAFAGAHTLLGQALRDQSRFTEALAALNTAVQNDPDDQTALEYRMHTARQLCDWATVAETEAALFARLADNPQAGINPLALMCAEPPAEPPAEPLAKEGRMKMGRILLHNARGYVAATVPPPAKDAAFAIHPAGDDAGRPLRVGYLSADFGQHAVGSLVASLFAGHNRAVVHPIGFSLTPDDGSPTAARIRAALDEVHDLTGLDSRSAARAIHAAGVDILVDLMGHTRHAHTAIAARRPAPVQVNYLGYPGTMGADFIDYIIADPTVIPPDHDCYYAEAVVRLPHSYFPAGADRQMATPPTRAQAGLPESGVVFCCFNDTYKITAPLFSVWMELLQQVPGSVLWLRHSPPDSRAALGRHAADAGIDPDRLIFAPKVPDHADHLARQTCADLFLDTRPYNAHTTASDALLAGLPVITCPGDTFASRVAASLLTALELPEPVRSELICPDPAAYRATALALARDPDRLAALKRTVAERVKQAPLFDTGRYTGHLEAAYQTMWQRHLAGHPPAPVTVPDGDRQ